MLKVQQKVEKGAPASVVALDEGGDRPRRKIQSVERALGLLEHLAESKEPIRLNELAKIFGLNISTCHHLLSTLMERGYVSQSPGSRTYFLGSKILELSGSRIRQFDLSDIATDGLRDLNARTGETVHLAALQGDDLITLLVLDSRHAVRVVSGPGGKSDAIHATATGKAILAWLPEAEIERILNKKGLTRFTEKTITSEKALMEELRHVRRNGFSMDNEEFQPGVICFGAAIRDNAGAVIGSFSCSMPGMRADDKHTSAVKQEVKETAKSISAKLGGVSHPEART